ADLSGSQSARFLIADAQATQVIDVVRQARSVSELEQALVAGERPVGIVIPPDYDRRRLGGERPAAQLLVDGADPVVLSAVRGLVDLPADRRTAPALHRLVSLAPVFELRAYYNPERRSAVNI